MKRTQNGTEYGSDKINMVNIKWLQQKNKKQKAKSCNFQKDNCNCDVDS